MRLIAALFGAAVQCLLISCSTQTPGTTAPVPASGGDPAPEIVALSPNSGSGRSQLFELTVSHATSATNIVDVQLLLDKGINGARACWIDFQVGSRNLTLRTDDGNAWTAPVPAGQPGAIENNQCALATAAVSTAVEGNRLKVIFPLSFKDGMRGDRTLYAIASSAGGHTGWKDKGTWTIP